MHRQRSRYHSSTLSSPIFIHKIVADKMKIWPDLLNISEEENEDLLTWALWVLGTAAQNNPPVQTSLFHLKVLDFALETLESSDSEKVKTKAVRCISAIVQHSPEPLKAFLDLKGLDIFEELFRTNPSSKLNQKILFFLNFIQTDNPELKQLYDKYQYISEKLNQ